MMEAVGLVDPALVEQAAGPARRHSARRPLRTGLIAACLLVAVGASVAYGMHRCRADNVVEALRADAV